MGTITTHAGERALLDEQTEILDCYVSDDKAAGIGLELMKADRNFIVRECNFETGLAECFAFGKEEIARWFYDGRRAADIGEGETNAPLLDKYFAGQFFDDADIEQDTQTPAHVKDKIRAGGCIDDAALFAEIIGQRIE